eukprot:scaffold58643_cov18-Tisochrysis_lutea.AAC.1
MKAPSRGKKLPQPLGDSSEHPFYLESKYRSGLPTSAWNTLRIVPEQQEQLQQMPLGKQQQQQKEQDSLHTGSQQQQQQQQQQHAGAEAQPQPTLDETPDNPYDNMIRVLTNELAQVKSRPIAATVAGSEQDARTITCLCFRVLLIAGGGGHEHAPAFVSQGRLYRSIALPA